MYGSISQYHADIALNSYIVPEDAKYGSYTVAVAWIQSINQ